MSIVTIYTCDKCDHSQETPGNMWDIGIVAKEKTDGRSFTSYQNSPRKGALWCRSCLGKLGLLPQAKDDPPKPDPTPTFEDMIREIIQEEIEASQ